MRNQAGVVGATILGVVIMVVTVGPSSAVPQSDGGIAIVDNARVFEEANQGMRATQQIQANVNTWQGQLTAIETALQGLINQRQQQSAIMTPEALRNLEADIEQKQIDLQRLRDDAQRQATATQTEVLAGLDAVITPVVAALASELGYSVVLNSQTPGLLYFNPVSDMTDQLIARLNTMDQ
jgi:Skp family chaperone for outer membrane proteins